MFKIKGNQAIRSELEACANKSIGEAASALASFLLKKSEETLNKIKTILAVLPNMIKKFGDLKLNEEYIKQSFEILLLRWAQPVIYVLLTLPGTNDDQDVIKT